VNAQHAVEFLRAQRRSQRRGRGRLSWARRGSAVRMGRCDASGFARNQRD
jgi:hypothetical protein